MAEKLVEVRFFKDTPWPFITLVYVPFWATLPHQNFAGHELLLFCPSALFPCCFKKPSPWAVPRSLVLPC